DLSSRLNARKIPGVRFVPVRFVPNASVFKDESCGGINIIISDRKLFQPVPMGIEIAVMLRQLYPEQWKVDSYLRLLANAATLEQVKRGDSPGEIVRSWTASLDEFSNRRARILLYD